jgi:hypothetical protein
MNIVEEFRSPVNTPLAAKTQSRDGDGNGDGSAHFNRRRTNERWGQLKVKSSRVCGRDANSKEHWDVIQHLIDRKRWGKMGQRSSRKRNTIKETALTGTKNASTMKTPLAIMEMSRDLARRMPSRRASCNRTNTTAVAVPDGNGRFCLMIMCFRMGGM